jgi:hypothetical protein
MSKRAADSIAQVTRSLGIEQRMTQRSVHLVGLAVCSGSSIWSVSPHAWPTCMARPPTPLNKTIVGCADGTVQLWNISTVAWHYIFSVWGSAPVCIGPSPALNKAQCASEAVLVCSGSLILNVSRGVWLTLRLT